jgi:hypothetical protein
MREHYWIYKYNIEMKPVGKKKPEISEFMQVGEYLDVYC